MQDQDQAQPQPVNMPEAIQGHRAESDRFGRLTEFLKEFAPAIGEARQPGTAADSGDGLIADAREAAIVACFLAVERIAEESFNFKPRPKPKASHAEPKGDREGAPKPQPQPVRIVPRRCI